ncbi:MAG: hypothetical protein JWO84_590 [Parcubacteria group bacterium]|nr:hypothetical protein [Parcubacteria group bacterium]
MAIALLAIGIPGSGKTTVLKPLAERYGLEYVNRDDIREELLGDATDQSKNKVIWEEANHRTAVALGAGRGVVLDGTFIERWKRQEMLSFLRENGAMQLIGVVAEIPLDEAQKRNAARDRIVPDTVMKSMHASLLNEPPILGEGFDALISLTDLTEVEALLAH